VTVFFNVLAIELSRLWKKIKALHEQHKEKNLPFSGFVSQHKLHHYRFTDACYGLYSYCNKKTLAGHSLLYQAVYIH